MLLGCLLWVDAFNFANYPAKNIAKKMTHWAIWLTFIQIAISLKCSMDVNIQRNRPCLLKAHYYLFELTTVLNIIVPMVYWNFLREGTIRDWEGIHVLQSSVCHSLPLVCTVINFCVTDVVIRASDSFYLIPIELLYSYFNYRTVKAQGYPVYWFLTWEDSNSFWVIGAL